MSYMNNDFWLTVQITLLTFHINVYTAGAAVVARSWHGLLALYALERVCHQCADRNFDTRPAQGIAWARGDDCPDTYPW
jgi:hypothetical protein